MHNYYVRYMDSHIHMNCLVVVAIIPVLHNVDKNSDIHIMKYQQNLSVRVMPLPVQSTYITLCCANILQFFFISENI